MILHYYIIDRQLFIDFNTSSKGIRVIIYYIKENKLLKLKQNSEIRLYLPVTAI